MLTWLIEHTLLLLPTWFWFVVAGVGAVLYFFSDLISLFPPAKPYARIIKVLGGVVLLAGVYLTGGAGITSLWQEQVNEMKDKVAKAEKASADANSQIKTVIQEKTKVIHDTQVIVQEKIVKDAAKMDAECKLDPVVVDDLNQAAGGKKK
jgi:hypothetical protein